MRRKGLIMRNVNAEIQSLALIGAANALGNIGCEMEELGKIFKEDRIKHRQFLCEQAGTHKYKEYLNYCLPDRYKFVFDGGDRHGVHHWNYTINFSSKCTLCNKEGDGRIAKGTIQVTRSMLETGVYADTPNKGLIHECELLWLAIDKEKMEGKVMTDETKKQIPWRLVPDGNPGPKYFMVPEEQARALWEGAKGVINNNQFDSFEIYDADGCDRAEEAIALLKKGIGE